MEFAYYIDVSVRVSNERYILGSWSVKAGKPASGKALGISLGNKRVAKTNTHTR